MSEGNSGTGGTGTNTSGISEDDAVEIAMQTMRYSGSFKRNANGKVYPYQLVRFGDLKPNPKASFLVDGLIPESGLVAIWGPPKCGKSFWAFDLFLHVAYRWRWRGRRVHGGPVIYLAFEGGSGFGARAEAFRRQHVYDRPFATGDEVWVEIDGVLMFEQPTMVREVHERQGELWYTVIGSETAVPRSALKLSDPPFFLLSSKAKLVRNHKALIASIDGQCDMPPVAVVLDTLNRSIEGSESSDEDMGQYLAAADVIGEEFGCVVPIVHHSGVDASRPRGHTSLTGTADSQIAIRRNASGHVLATVEYMKDGPEGASFVSALKTLVVGTDDEGQPLTSCALVPVEDSSGVLGAAVSAAGAKLTGVNGLAFDALVTVIERCGEDAPDNGHIPAFARVCSLANWREQFYGTYAADKQSTKKKALGRAIPELQKKKLIGVWGDWVWITT